MSLEAAINTQEGQFITGGFSGNISGAKAWPTKKGGTLWKAVIRDGQFEADLTSFKRTFEHVDGKRVTFSGMSLARKANYNGRPQIVIGDNAKWHSDGSAPTPATDAAGVAEHSKQTQAYQIPVTSTENTAPTIRTGMTVKEMAETWAEVADAAFVAFGNRFKDDALARSAAMKAPEWAALWWFGEKSVRPGAGAKHTPPPRAPSGDLDEGDIPF